MVSGGPSLDAQQGQRPARHLGLKGLVEREVITIPSENSIPYQNGEEIICHGPVNLGPVGDLGRSQRFSREFREQPQLVRGFDHGQNLSGTDQLIQSVNASLPRSPP